MAAGDSFDESMAGVVGAREVLQVVEAVGRRRGRRRVKRKALAVGGRGERRVLLVGHGVRARKFERRLDAKSNCDSGWRLRLCS